MGTLGAGASDLWGTNRITGSEQRNLHITTSSGAGLHPGSSPYEYLSDIIASDRLAVVHEGRKDASLIIMRRSEPEKPSVWEASCW
jgi:hypothetical protein